MKAPKASRAAGSRSVRPKLAFSSTICCAIRLALALLHEALGLQQRVEGFGEAADGAQKAEHRGIIRAGRGVQEIAKVVACAEDGGVALDAIALYMAAVMAFFLSARLRVRVVTPASKWVGMSVMWFMWAYLAGKGR